jgi:hypothetical protein
MPKGPQGHRRPADVIGAAITVAKVATEELHEKLTTRGRKLRSWRASAKVHARKLTQKERRDIAKKAATAHWA